MKEFMRSTGCTDRLMHRRTFCLPDASPMSRRAISRRWKRDYEDNFNPDTGEIMLGDIVISVDRVREQAAAYGHSERRNLRF